MHQAESQRMREIEKELIKTDLWDLLGIALMAIGLFAKFNTEAEGLLPGNPVIINGILLVGGVILVWGQIKAFVLNRRKAKFESDFNAKLGRLL